MIADSGKHIFEAVFVYQLDHFAVTDTTAPSIKPKKNGVRVIPARENIRDDAYGMFALGCGRPANLINGLMA